MSKDDFEFRLDAPITRVTQRQILDSLRAFAELRDRRPFTTRDYDRWKDKVCSSGTISQRLGSWRQALARIGIETGVRSRRYSARELMDNLELVWLELRRPPGEPIMTRQGYRISGRTYRRRWGSLRNACLLLSRFKRDEITEEQLLGVAPARQARDALSLKVRWDVLKGDNYACVKCGARPPDVELEVDHIIAVARHGTNDLSNLQTLCRPCNQGKKDS
jgi:5-methylcytosine-specific restriction endonuclease McrA